MSESETNKSLDFIRTMVEDDLETGKFDGRIQTRFPPEPNGFLHIGHAKAICIDFGIAQEYKGKTNLRFDDTNPEKEDDAYVAAIKEDIRWLGFEWDGEPYFASNYFDELYQYAVALIEKGKAYVCSLTAEEISKQRGSWKGSGEESPHRARSVEENLALFKGMKAGEFSDGQHCLRAKIDMSSPNMNLRDPVIYRIRRVHHHRTGDTWCIYPTYDFAHGLSDSIERITHSICTLEFENHRPLYDWFLDELEVYHPQQIEFARLELTYTMMSKRKLLKLVEGGHVDGWSDPRMPTLAGLRRRGYSPAALRNFCGRIGVAKMNTTVDIALLEHVLREDLNANSNRVMGVLKPLKVVIENYSEDQVENLDAVNNPGDPGAGSRTVPFSKTLYIEQDDFMEDPPKKFFRLAPGREVRLRYAFFITCTSVVKDEQTGEVTEVRCTYDPETKGGNAPDGRKVKGTIHWVSAKSPLKAEVRLYDHLFTKEDPSDVEEGKDFVSNLNPESMHVLPACFLEPSLKWAEPGERFQFERLGYFCVDTNSTKEKPIFNRTVTLRDTWKKSQKKGGGKG